MRYSLCVCVCVHVCCMCVSARVCVCGLGSHDLSLHKFMVSAKSHNFSRRLIKQTIASMNMVSICEMRTHFFNEGACDTT